MPTWNVQLTTTAVETIRRIKDRRVQRSIGDRIRQLAIEPAAQGKPLVGPLSGFYRVKVLKRYRVLYTVEQETVTVYVVAAGIRKEGDKHDIYALAQRLIQQGLATRAETE
jgi:mRNA interferase RelE/StbE